jgi:hypothetical protein
MEHPPAEHSGRVLVIAMVGGAVILGLIALKYRRPSPFSDPAQQPTSLPATAPATQTE